jgi:PAS domain S-box-containing protein
LLQSGGLSQLSVGRESGDGGERVGSSPRQTARSLAAGALRALMAAAPFGVALLDRHLRFVEVNTYLARVDGVAPADHVGRSLAEVMPGLADQIEGHAHEALSTRRPVERIPLRARDAHGLLRHWLVSLHPIEQGDTFALGIVVLDVSEQARTAEELRRRTRQQAAVARFGQRALAGEDLETLLDEAAAVAAETLQVEFAEVLEHLPEVGRLLLRAGRGWREGLVGLTTIGAGPETQAGMVLSTGQPVVVEELDHERRFAAVGELREHGVVSGASVPVETQAGVYGVLGAHSTRPRRFAHDDLVFLQSLANALGAAIERGRAEAQLREGAHRLGLAMKTARLGSWEWELATGRLVWSEALESIYGLPPGSFGGTVGEALRRLHPEDRDHVFETLRRVVDDECAVREFEHRLVRPDGEVRWALATAGPLRGEEERLLGVIGVVMDITDRKRAEDERARLLESERRARQRLALLARITAAIGATLDPRELVDAVARLAVPALAPGCAVDVLEGSDLERAAARHVDQDAEAELREQSADELPHLLRALEEGVAVPRPGGMAVPMLTRDRVLGVLSFLWDTADVGPEEVELARDIGRRLALALENSRLFRERAEGEQRFRHLAQTLQSSLLPPHLPDIPGLDLAARYRPAAKGLDVGGDFYDVFPLPGRSWGVAMGDVCGKGPQAARLTALARYTLRAAAVQEGMPSDAIRVLNGAVLRDAARAERFLTLAFARLHPSADGALVEICLGGHAPPFVLRANGSVEAAGRSGTLVGVVEEPELVDLTITLARGDLLLFFTDGLTEARSSGELFGEERLARLLAGLPGLPCDEVLRRVERTVAAFDPDLARDDLAMLAVRVLPV